MQSRLISLEANRTSTLTKTTWQRLTDRFALSSLFQPSLEDIEQYNHEHGYDKFINEKGTIILSITLKEQI